MMGRKLAPRARIELINLEEFVPQDHLLRAVDRYLDLRDFREHLSGFYSHFGRPSIDPELITGCLSSATATASGQSEGYAKKYT